MGLQVAEARRATAGPQRTAASTRPPRSVPTGHPHALLALQRQAGNAAVASLFVQRKEGCDCGGSCCTSSEEKEKEQPEAATVTIQRDADDVRIKGLFPDRASVPDEIFFEHAKHDVPPDEKLKLDVIAKADKKAKLTLRGFASEEGTKGGNTAIVNNRMVMVSFFLGKFGHQGARKLENKVAGAEPNIDYRRQRRVEVVRPGVKKDDCSTGAIVPCGPEVAEAYARAKVLLTSARAKLSGPEASRALRLFYKTNDPGIAALVTGQLDAVAKIVDESSKVQAAAGKKEPTGAHHRCENLCKECGSGFVATAGPSPPAVLFCPPYFDGKGQAGVATDPAELRAHILIHECGHAIGLRELARVFERAFPFLRTGDALKNTDSLTAFVRQLVTPGQTSNGPVTPDKGAGRSRATTKALAFTERWAFLAHVEANNLYNHAADLDKDKSSWEQAFDLKDPAALALVQNYEAIADEFPPMSPRSKVPTVDDRQRLAAVNDRFERMATVLAKPLDISVGGATVVWSKGPGDSITVPATFALDTLGDQCRALLRALAQQTDGISAEAVEKYIRLAPKLSGRRAPGFVPQ